MKPASYYVKKGQEIWLFQACSKEKSGIFSYHVGIESPKGNEIEDESTAVAIGEALASHKVGDGGDNLEKRFLAFLSQRNLVLLWKRRINSTAVLRNTSGVSMADTGVHFSGWFLRRTPWGSES